MTKDSQDPQVSETSKPSAWFWRMFFLGVSPKIDEEKVKRDRDALTPEQRSKVVTGYLEEATKRDAELDRQRQHLNVAVAFSSAVLGAYGFVLGFAITRGNLNTTSLILGLAGVSFTILAMCMLNRIIMQRPKALRDTHTEPLTWALSLSDNPDERYELAYDALWDRDHIVQLVKRLLVLEPMCMYVALALFPVYLGITLAH